MIKKTKKTIIHKIKSSTKLRHMKNDFFDLYHHEKYHLISLKDKNRNHKFKNIFKKNKFLSVKEMEKTHDTILKKNLLQLKLSSFSDNAPLVSIIILNRNGIHHLKRLFKDFKANIQYPSYEIILVDNASTDESLSFLEKIAEDLPLIIIKNNKNKNFSQANNQASKVAKGDYLLLLNNDVEPTYGWLNMMMQSALKSYEIGAVGARLIYPDCSQSPLNKHNSYKIQHTGIAFKIEEGFIKPYNMSNGDPFDENDNSEKLRPAVTAAALLIKKDKYEEVNGLDEGYDYGYEDVDLCLKLLKAGYNNIYCPQALLFHYEFGTQETDKNQVIINRRLKNKELYIEKWDKWLKEEGLRDKLENKRIFSEKPLHVALIVTEKGVGATAGDYFTALELGEALQKIGWDVSFIPRKGPGNWYEISEDIDVIVSLLDAYNPRKIKCSNKNLIKIAWPRNWFERWVSHPSLSNYDLILASSETARAYIEKNSGLKTLLLPIATNLNRFNNNISPVEEYDSDYCFTGSYWDDPREIIEMLNPEKLPYNFKLYGKNWEKIDKLKKYHHGFISYSQLPQVYASTKIVIDDANRVTLPYGAVNSRVYDAISSGALVLTNGKIGAQETFEWKLPYFRSPEELNDLISYYLKNEEERLSKIKELQEFVINNHTYENRALTLKNILDNYISQTKIAIKIPAPEWETVNEWGDYHLALGLKKEFEKKGCLVKIQILPEWDDNIQCDVVMVLRGLSRYYPKKQHFNIMWNISHPDKITMEEYNQYDHVLIASEYWAEKIKELLDVPVDYMLQCTDPELFYPEFSERYVHDILFVGNSRKVFRKIIKDLMPSNYDLAVYGKGWERFLDKKYIKGEHIPNHELRKAYSSCKILLNDHWDDMRDKGFISNRLFDGSACGSLIISDKVHGARDVFGEELVTYNNPEELKSLIEHYLNEEKRKEKFLGRFVDENTYEKRVEQILKILKANQAFE